MQLEVELAHLSDDARQGMQSDLAQMDAIINQFLEYARPSDKSSLGPTDLSGLLKDCTREVAHIHDVRVEGNIADGLHVNGNSTDLKRVIHNLVENARRYGKTDGSDVAEITINARAEQGLAVIDVADRGPGVPEAEIERLLRPFTRLDTARGQANGAGLGLAIVERVIKRHLGSLKLSNREGGGLQIRIGIPLDQAAR
jgi:two-component system osmolarity sensor histidine kinase EnvZ